MSYGLERGIIVGKKGKQLKEGEKLGYLIVRKREKLRNKLQIVRSYVFFWELLNFKTKYKFLSNSVKSGKNSNLLTFGGQPCGSSSSAYLDPFPAASTTAWMSLVSIFLV